MTGTKIYSYLSGPPGIPRHTFTSSLTRSGVDLVTVKDLLGHATSDTTVRYAHSDYDTEARPSFDALIGGRARCGARLAGRRLQMVAGHLSTRLSRGW